MGTGTKVTLAFLAGAAAGAAALAYLNRDKLDFEGVKSVAADWLNKGIELKDSLLEKLDLSKNAEDDFIADGDLEENAPSREHPDKSA